MAYKNIEDRKAYHRRWYRQNREKRIRQIVEYQQRVLDYIREYKLSQGCADCGYREHAEALDFDHIDEKTFSLSQAHRVGAGFERIKAEIQKCEVVCANCHRVRTLLRRTSSVVEQRSCKAKTSVRF